MTPPADSVALWLAAFGTALARGDADAAAALFHDDGCWRDLTSFTGSIRTLDGRPAIARMLRATLAHVRPGAWTLDGAPSASGDTVEAWLRFETAVGRGRAVLRLKGGRAWTLMTMLAELIGHEEPAGDRRPLGVAHGAYGTGQRSWLEAREARRAALGRTEQPWCLIVGGGQGGLALAARLKRLGVPALIVDRHARSGDAWRSRYRSLVLHDPVWYDHMPYLPFPDHWPVFTPKDKMGDWLEAYASIMELDVWGSTTCLGATRDEAAGTWSVTVERDGERHLLRPAHLVLATGLSGLPQVPAFPGADRFEGTQLHSGAYAGGAPWKDRQCVVVGSNNSAHDICADLWEHGARVTMLQRSSTMVARSESLQALGWGRLFSEDALRRGVTTERADMTLASMPYRVLAQAQTAVTAEIARRDAGFYDRLRAAGFLLDFGEDGSGLSMKYLRRGSGYYIDVGASELIADGRIGLRSGVTVRELRARSVVLDDGSELPADLVVYATGFGPLSDVVARLVSPEVAERIGPIWGLGSGTARDPGPWAGELRNMWTPTAQPGLWIHGGNLQQARFYSLQLALQLKARFAGIPMPVYDPAHAT
ncbi:MAG: NAD(P)/FAD-dependent oxidoreductase [Burkholderiales bacterium]|nr:MAG: NAD(P)/FAD-dependent oxidoreductase [Burkholderiales bacterium]